MCEGLRLWYMFCTPRSNTSGTCSGTFHVVSPFENCNLDHSIRVHSHPCLGNSCCKSCPGFLQIQGSNYIYVSSKELCWFDLIYQKKNNNNNSWITISIAWKEANQKNISHKISNSLENIPGLYLEIQLYCCACNSQEIRPSRPGPRQLGH